MQTVANRQKLTLPAPESLTPVSSTPARHVLNTLGFRSLGFILAAVRVTAGLLPFVCESFTPRILNTRAESLTPSLQEAFTSCAGILNTRMP